MCYANANTHHQKSVYIENHIQTIFHSNDTSNKHRKQIKANEQVNIVLVKWLTTFQMEMIKILCWIVTNFICKRKPIFLSNFSEISFQRIILQIFYEYLLFAEMMLVKMKNGRSTIRILITFIYSLLSNKGFPVLRITMQSNIGTNRRANDNNHCFG